MPIISEIKGWSPVIHSLAHEVGLITAAVYGAVWRYCQMDDHICKASLETISNDLGVDKATVLRHIKKLCEKGYLKDQTPKRRNAPHTYRDTGKVGISGRIEVGPEKRPAAEAQSGPLCKAILGVCKLKLSFVQGDRVLSKSLSDTMRLLIQENAKPGEVNEFEEWRQVYHWSAKGSPAPTIKQVGEYWGQYEAWVSAGRPAPTQNGAHHDKRNKTARHNNPNNHPVSRATGLGEWTAEELEELRRAGVPLPDHGQGDGELPGGNVAAPS